MRRRNEGVDFIITITYNEKLYTKRKVKTIKTICECAGSILFMAALISLIAFDMPVFFLIYFVVALVPFVGALRCLRILKHGQYNI